MGFDSRMIRVRMTCPCQATSSSTSWGVLQQEIDNIKKSPMMNMTKWTHESKGFMAVLARLGEITHILLKIPK
eukprot:3240349-Lingulodinium_polyedra.AAC.1